MTDVQKRLMKSHVLFFILFLLNDCPEISLRIRMSILLVPYLYTIFFTLFHNTYTQYHIPQGLAGSHTGHPSCVHSFAE